MQELSDIFPIGLEHSRTWVVSREMLYSPGGDSNRATLSSPSMINEMEITATEMLDVAMPDDGFTVGFHVDVRHVSPAPLGTRVKTTARLLDVSGTKFRFHVKAYDIDQNRLIGIGTHRRAAIFP